MDQWMDGHCRVQMFPRGRSQLDFCERMTNDQLVRVQSNYCSSSYDVDFQLVDEKLISCSNVFPSVFSATTLLQSETRFQTIVKREVRYDVSDNVFAHYIIFVPGGLFPSRVNIAVIKL